MYPGADTPTGPPVSLRVKLRFVYPFHIAMIALMFTLSIGRH